MNFPCKKFYKRDESADPIEFPLRYAPEDANKFYIVSVMKLSKFL